MNTNHTRRAWHRIAATGVGATVMALGALASTATANAATPFQQTCASWGPSNVDGKYGQYSSYRSGEDLNEVCALQLWDEYNDAKWFYQYNTIHNYFIVNKRPPGPSTPPVVSVPPTQPAPGSQIGDLPLSPQ